METTGHWLTLLHNSQLNYPIWVFYYVLIGFFTGLRVKWPSKDKSRVRTAVQGCRGARQNQWNLFNEGEWICGENGGDLNAAVVDKPMGPLHYCECVCAPPGFGCLCRARVHYGTALIWSNRTSTTVIPRTEVRAWRNGSVEPANRGGRRRIEMAGVSRRSSGEKEAGLGRGGSTSTFL